MTCLIPYEPLNALKPIAENVWIVDGPEIAMSYVVGTLPFTTRMTVIRLADGALLLHSPTPLSEDLVEALAALGEIRFLIAPNRLHFWWIGEWKARFPNAIAYAAPGVREAAKERFSGFDAELCEEAPAAWAGEVELFPLIGSFMTELELFHVPSKTLVLTDMIENFERDRVTCRHMPPLLKIGGVLDPNGSTPRDVRLTFLGHKKKLRQTVKEMLERKPERVLIAHGRCYLTNAEAELRRAFRWLL
ncbi:DUF4336 domain-containing protein [Afifella sp. H1R]|uniref:DUF4336 domain-containing protein n=1 Tax=Afifella sp. H1R TaxID=2908841 RepID=UPI001F3E393E|nr:DUF4336 domain-containing protein [Afifella sp. H1R]MCF1503277.1 DUF4336 domain-containing protein [Afifella sp. H1R]